MPAISSMTGYASLQKETAAGRLTVELRSVNSRFLDLSLRLSDAVKPLEPVIRELITKNVQRGKLECSVFLSKSGVSQNTALNAEAAAGLARLQTEALKIFPEARPFSAAEILAYPGVIAAPEIDMEALETDVRAALTEALASFTATRNREGAALAAVLLTYCSTIEEIASQISGRLPDILAAMKAKLEERLSDALSKTLSENSSLTKEEVNERIRSELTLYALRMDVAEEISRLLTHTREVRRVLAAGGAAGRRLDFLMQELNREANTLGSKAVAVEMTDASVNLKLAIEKMREQIQNLE